MGLEQSMRKQTAGLEIASAGRHLKANYLDQSTTQRRQAVKHKPYFKWKISYYKIMKLEISATHANYITIIYIWHTTEIWKHSYFMMITLKVSIATNAKKESLILIPAIQQTSSTKLVFVCNKPVYCILLGLVLVTRIRSMHCIWTSIGSKSNSAVTEVISHYSNMTMEFKCWFQQKHHMQ